MLLGCRLAVRSLRRTPLLAAVVTASIGLSIGASTTVFAWVEHLVRRPLPTAQSVDRLVSYERSGGGAQGRGTPSMVLPHSVFSSSDSAETRIARTTANRSGRFSSATTMGC